MISYMIYIIPTIILSAFLQIVIHETGHMVGGLLTGWKLLYIQLYKYLFAKENGRYHWKRVRNSAFQCMMYPEHGNDNPILYTVMGCYMNLTAAVISLVAMLILYDIKCFLVLIWLTLFGIIQFIINFIPSNKRLCNDGSCCRILQSDITSRRSHNLQLLVARKLQEGHSYKMVTPELICLNSNYAGNDITAYHAALEYYYHIDRSEYESARKALSKIDRNADISPKVMNIILLEEVYLELWMCMLDKENISLNISKYEPDMMKYIERHADRRDINALRIKAMWNAYDCFLRNEYRNAQLKIEEAEKEIKNIPCVYEGEKLFNIEQVKKIKDCLYKICADCLLH